MLGGQLTLGGRDCRPITLDEFISGMVSKLEGVVPFCGGAEVEQLLSSSVLVVC